MFTRTRTLFGALRAAGLALLLCGLSSAPAAAQIPARYSVTHLGTVRADGDGSSVATALNDEGVVVGISDGNAGEKQAFRWDPQTGISNLHPYVNFGGRHNAAHGINNANQIVGESNTFGNPFEFSHALFYGPGAYDLNGLGSFFGGQNSRATAVNDSGTACGWAQIAGGALFPYRWSLSGGIERLFTPNAVGGKAFAINSLGQAAGSMDLPGVTVATVWAPPGGGVILIRFNGAIAQESYGLNDNGAVVGARRARNGRWAAWRGDLGTQRVRLLRRLPGALQSWAYDVNNAGQVVGSAGGMAPATLNAVVWQGNRAVNLNTRIPQNSGWRLTRAHAINESGQIAGEGVFQGRTRAFLLTPAP